MAEKTAPISLGYGTPAWSEYEAAQQEARDILSQRQNRLFDPVALAAAQGFLAPTKTGSFGESLGNVAGQLIPAMQAEEKSNMDMAKMRMELAQQGLQTTIQGQNAQQDQELFARMAGIPPKTAKPSAMPVPVQGGAPIPSAGGAVALPSAPPAPPAPAVSAPPPAPPAGALAQAAPAPISAAPPSPLAQAAPQAPAQPVGQQLFPAQPSTWNDEETAYASAQRRAGKPMGEILKEIDENRRKNKVVTTSGTTDIPSGMFYGQYDPTPTETYIHGFGSVKIPASDAKKLGLAKDADEYAAIARQIMKGYETKTAPSSSAQPTTNSTPTGSAPATAPTQRPTTAQADADAAALKTEKEKDAVARAKRTELAIDKLDPAIEVRSIAETAKNLASQEGAEKVFGLFEKPTIRAALAKMVDEGSFTPIGFRDAMVALNIRFDTPQKPNEKGEDYERRKQDILDRYYQMGTQAARAKFEASVLAKGQGAFSDGERRMFADTTISTRMSVSSINKTSDMLIARANFAESIANKILDNEMSYDKFRRTPEYKNMLKAYEAKLQSIWSGNTRSSGVRPNLPSANENAQKQGI
jgi:hypothetical protein